jgi:hypothetical protein
MNTPDRHEAYVVRPILAALGEEPLVEYAFRAERDNSAWGKGQVHVTGWRKGPLNLMIKCHGDAPGQGFILGSNKDHHPFVCLVDYRAHPGTFLFIVLTRDEARERIRETRDGTRSSHIIRDPDAKAEGLAPARVGRDGFLKLVAGMT